MYSFFQFVDAFAENPASFPTIERNSFEPDLLNYHSNLNFYGLRPANN